MGIQRQAGPGTSTYNEIRMKSVCEVTTPNCMAVLKFNDQDKEQVEKVEEILGEMADEGLVYGIEFHAEQ